MTPPDLAVTIVILAKDTRTAKRRLGLPPGVARGVARRLALSSVRTAMKAVAVGEVMVVTSDPDITDDVTAAGAVVVPEGRPIGINRAAALGQRHALSLRPEAPVATMVADLPYLRAADLDEVVFEFRAQSAPLYVADHHATGTTMLIQRADQRPGFGFGRHSAAMHARLGYAAAQRELRGLRYDFDTPEDCALYDSRPAWTTARLGA